MTKLDYEPNGPSRLQRPGQDGWKALAFTVGILAVLAFAVIAALVVFVVAFIFLVDWFLGVTVQA